MNFTKAYKFQQIQKLAYHRSYYRILGKHHVADVIHVSFEPTLGDISTQSYYVKQFSFEPVGQLKNELFDNNRTLSLEGCCLNSARKTVNVSNFMTMVVGIFSNPMTRYMSIIYIYLIQRCKMPLRIQLISIY